MSKNVSTFLAATATFLIALTVAVAGPGSVTSADGTTPPPATTTPAGTDGNPWHG